MIQVFFSHTEDDMATVTGPRGTFVVAHNGTDYSITGMARDPRTGDYPELWRNGDYSTALAHAKQLAAGTAN